MTDLSSSPAFEALADGFDVLEEWDDRYRYLIELGRTLEPLPDEAHSADNKVQGCASQVWLETSRHDGRLSFRGDSDAHIVKGLVAVAITLFSDHTPAEILSTDAMAAFRRLGLEEHLTPQRSNGLKSMVERIRRDAGAA